MATEQTQAKPALVRGSGLPKDGDESHYFAYDQQGNVWALSWSKENKAWQGVGFVDGWPQQMIFRGDAVSRIASHVGPVHAISA
jgi:hypothetical protein